MKVLFISNLFPDRDEPNRGLVNARLLRHLSSFAEVRVLALRPHMRGWLARWSAKRSLPEDAAFKPRYAWVPYLPKLGGINHRFYATALKSSIEEIRATFPFDVVLASWLYPDAAAVSQVAQSLGFPFVCVAQGSDVHQYLKMDSRRPMIIGAVNNSARTIARSGELARLLLGDGAEENKLKVIHNGVEGDIFCLRDRQKSRELLGFSATEKIVLYVGNFLPVKNPDLLVESFAKWNNLVQSAKLGKLVMIGDGPLAPQLRAKAAARGVADQVVWTGALSPVEVANYLAACDLLCIPSDNEGLPNVLLEALASGRPVVATDVGGIAEVLNHDILGRLVPPRDADAMAEAMKDLLLRSHDEAAISAVGQSYSWQTTAASYHDVLLQAVRDKN